MHSTRHFYRAMVVVAACGSSRSQHYAHRRVSEAVVRYRHATRRAVRTPMLAIPLTSARWTPGRGCINRPFHETCCSAPVSGRMWTLQAKDLIPGGAAEAALR